MTFALKKTFAALGSLSLAMAGSAHAEILLNLLSPATQYDTSYQLPFVATSTATILGVGGFQRPSFEESEDNGVYLDATGPNLLGSAWHLKPASAGSLAFTENDDTSVPGLEFGGVSPGFYDTYSQSFATTPGATYVVDLLFSEDSGGPSGFFVQTTSGSGVPEPASWAIMLTGLGALGLTMRASRGRRLLAAA